MKVKEYYPPFFDPYGTEEECEVTSKEALLDIPFVKQWGQRGGFARYCYRKSPHNQACGFLIALFNESDARAERFTMAVLYPSKDEHPEEWFDKPPWEDKP